MRGYYYSNENIFETSLENNAGKLPGTPLTVHIYSDKV